MALVFFINPIITNKHISINNFDSFDIFRNEVWRYNQWPGFGKAARMSTFKGFKYAAVLMAVTIAADQFLGFSKHGHDDHH